MTQEEKAKRYDGALHAAKAWHNTFINTKKDKNLKQLLETIFPELAESEDEKIRKALLDLFKIENFNGYVALNGIDVDDVIAWLEKQGEQRSKLVDFDYNANDSDLQEVTYFIPNGFHAEMDGNKVVVKQGKQKPKWTEEDDYNVQCCIAKAESDIANGCTGRNKELIDWLKFLKQRMEESK